jgi:hypothetical protein
VVPLTELTRRVEKLDAKLKPIAGRLIRFEDVRKHVTACFDPLGEAGVHAEGDVVIRDLVEVYACGDDTVRKTIRKLLAENPSFTWAATLPWLPLTRDRLRDHLLLFSMKDQERDTRDALLQLRTLCTEATVSGIDVGAVLAEVAALSSTEDRYGWGSTRDLLLGAIPGRERR